MRFLNLHRLMVYAVASLVLGCAVILTSLVTTPARLSGATDFPAFYNAGRIARTEPSRLYDPALQRELFSDVAPLIDPQLVPYYAYTPYFSLMFVPLSVLPYPAAFACWIALCFAMLIVGLALVWRVAELPDHLFKYGAVIAVSFLPFYAWWLFMGQTTAFGFFVLALSIYFERKAKPFQSGLALSLLSYKPPLLILFVPMLIVTKRWKTLSGFSLGGALLGALSLFVIGISGVPSYLAMVRGFANKKVGLAGLTHIEVDAYSFFVNLTGGNSRAALVLLVAFIIPVGYLLVKTWRSNPANAWITAITWTCILNYYVLIYDSSLVILSSVLLIGYIRNEVPRSLLCLLVVVFVVPWFHGPMARAWGFQPMTVALIVFGFYQIVLVMRPRCSQINESRSNSVPLSTPVQSPT